MRKRKVSIAVLTLVFFLTSFFSHLGLPVGAEDKGKEKLVLVDVKMFNQKGKEIDSTRYPDRRVAVDESLQLRYHWKLSGAEFKAGERQSFGLPKELKIQQEQNGSLVSNDNVTVGTFQATMDGTVTITFNEAQHIEEAQGTLTIQSVLKQDAVGDQKNIPVSFALDDRQVIIPVPLQEMDKEQELDGEKKAMESEKDLNETTAANPSGDDGKENEAETTENQAEKSSASSSEAITENIITDVKLYQRNEDEAERLLAPGEEIRVDNPYDQFKVRIHYSFALPNNHDYGAGSTFTIHVPDVFNVPPNPEPVPLRTPQDVEYASFVINNQGEVVITFNENISENSNISGFVELWSEFDSHYSGEAEQVISFPISEGVSIDYPVTLIPRNAEAIHKSGVANKSYNTETITWTVDLNKNLQTIENAIVQDETEGNHAFVPGSIKVYKLAMRTDGSIDESKTEELTNHGFGSQFPLELGTIDSAYRIVYQTKIAPGDTGTSYKNKVTLFGDGMEDVSSETSVGVTRGQPLDKRASGYDSSTQMVTWEIKYNYDEKEIAANQAKLTDIFGEGHELVYTTEAKDGIEVFEVDIDPDTGQEGEQRKIDDFSVTSNPDGFVLDFGKALHKAYKITYKTKASERVEQGLTLTNTVRDEFDHEKTASRPISQQIFHKSHNGGQTNYDGKETGWTITINGDEYHMENVQVVDTLPAGFTPKDIVVTHGGQSLQAEEDYEWKFEDGKLTIDFLQPIDQRVVITYKTEIDFDNVQPEANGSFTNSAQLTWDADGNNGSGEKEAEAVFNPDNYTKNNGFKSGSYNLETKAIDWTIGVNYNKATLKDVVVEDIIQGAQNFDLESVRVFHMELTGGANGYEKGAELAQDEYEVVEINGPNGEPGFQVKLGDIDSPYLITFQTNLNNQLVFAEYQNKAIVKSEGKDDLELTASVKPTRGGEYTKKDVNQDQNNPRIAHWKVDINFTQSTVSNVSLVDTPSKNQAFLKDTFTLYETIVTENNIVKGEALTEGVDYSLNFQTNEDDTETFTLKFLDKIERPYILEYDTYILYKGDGNISNDAHFNGDETKSVPTDDSRRVAINLSGMGGGIDGEIGGLEISKIDADSKEPLEGAEFTLYDQSGQIALKTATTGEDGKVQFSNLLYGDYILKETKAPEGYFVGIADQRTVNVNSELIPVVVENKKMMRAVELTKVDKDSEKRLGGAVFELQKKNGEAYEAIARFTTDGQGIIYQDQLEPGEYQFIEISAPYGYRKQSEPIPFTIVDQQTEAVKVTAYNVRVPDQGGIINGQVELTKVDLDNKRAPLPGAVFDLQDSKGNTIQKGLTTNHAGKLLVTGLAPGSYQFIETEAPFGYQLNPTPIPFTIHQGDSTIVEVSAENELMTGSVQLIKVDRDNRQLRLAGAVFELQDDKGNTLRTGLVTDHEGTLTVTGLKPGNYQFVETKAPFGYDIDQTPISFTIEKGQVETIVKQMENRVSTGSVELMKVDKENNEKRLKGAEYRLESASGDVLLKGLTTNDEGKLVVHDLKPGRYQFIETKAPKHYQLDSTPIMFTIEKGQTITLSIVAQNELISGAVQLTKVDQQNHGYTLAGAVFDLRDDKGNILQKGLTTNREGKLLVNDLKPGVYQFVETKAPKGYQLRTTPVSFTIPLSPDKVVQVIVTNEKQELTGEKIDRPGNLGPPVDPQDHQASYGSNHAEGIKAGETLPNTATSMFNGLFIGAILLLAGLLLLMKKKGKQR
ncbi:LPXTG cell wall anchor domain protein [Anoxybacillus sp. B7M1]|uniref:SpaA isopeptide-forming pilin-related protein n=1 Tax=unclassified Anoxybacillus TaxID=2639704 RepID=UPI0005CD8556|nr:MULTISPECIES: SpaA isopeptide-forming pilin-related protein [unclassified Anoxybacillus]ANB58856.1 LPXTG cell wall anchor domain protein [Anoxybacillus sp. B2M1]ANB63760.1 LPXTG cell wall anchor domain protein [Anoxybacillus sp. B7M1]